MIVQNLFQPPDTYTKASEFISLSALPISLYVFNNPVRVVVLKKNPGGGQDYQVQPEQVIAPGSCQITGAVGFRIKNATPGSQAIVSFAIPEYDPKSPDASIVGYTPTTLVVTASGGIGVQSTPSYQKSAALVDITTPAGNVETDILNVPIRAADINSGSRFEFVINCDYLNNVADSLATWRAYIGATKVFDTGALSLAAGGAFGAIRQATRLVGSLELRNALNSQWTDMAIFTERSAVAAPVTGEGNYSSLAALAGVIGGGSAVDMSLDQTFRVTFFWAANDANHSWRKFGSLMVLY